MKNIPARSGFRERIFTDKEQIEMLTVRTETLDHNLPAGYVPALIKIDVEGAERQVIEGAIEPISRYKPIIIFEQGKGVRLITTLKPSRSTSYSMMRPG